MSSGRAGGGDGYALAKGRWKSVMFPSDCWVHVSVQVAVFRYDGKYVLETVVMYLSNIVKFLVLWKQDTGLPFPIVKEWLVGPIVQS